MQRIFYALVFVVLFGGFVFGQVSDNGVVDFESVVDFDGIFDKMFDWFAGILEYGFAFFLSLYFVWYAFFCLKAIFDDRHDDHTTEVDDREDMMAETERRNV